MIFRWLLFLLLAGCASSASASKTWIINKGGDGGGNYLASLAVTTPEQVNAACGGEHVGACTDPLAFTPWGTIPGLLQYSVIVQRHASVPAGGYEVWAHESCHYVAAVLNIRPDPCHNEDHGVLELK